MTLLEKEAEKGKPESYKNNLDLEVGEMQMMEKEIIADVHVEEERADLERVDDIETYTKDEGQPLLLSSSSER